MSQETVAYVDTDLEELIPDYLDNRRSDVIQIRDLLQQGDLDEIQRLGHSMKGSGGGYGFHEITEIGKNIEEAAVAGNVSRIAEMIEYLSGYLSTVKIVWQDDE
ncbi:MAG: Hpt domain-containing protein [bacterium]